MATAEAEVPTGKKRSVLRKKDDSTSENGSSEGKARNKRHHKLHWSPRLGRKDNGSADDDDDDDSKESPHKNLWSAAGKKHLAALHWGSRLMKKSDDAHGDANIDSGAAPKKNSGIPRLIGGPPRVLDGVSEEGILKKFQWHPRQAGLSESMSDDISEEGEDVSSTKKENVAERLHRIRRKLNPLGKKAHWRYRIGDHRIDEENDGFEMDGLDPLENLCSGSGGFSMAGDLEVPDRNTLPYNRGDSVDSLGLAVHDDQIFHRSPTAISYNTPGTSSIPRHLRNGSYDCDLVSLGGGAFGSGTSVATEGKAIRKYKSETKEFRVKPFHCFAPEIVHMTEAELYQSMLKPSEKVEYLQSYIAPSSNETKELHVCPLTERMWGNPHDGRIGSLRVEVLGCVGLAPSKPDVAVYLVCGDVPFVTDVLQSCRSPIWPPCSKRAAVFPIHHAYARLYTGVFATKKEKNDDFCGRVVLDLAALRPNSEYDVTLPLRASSFIYDRRPRGVIRLRFSCHWFSEKAALLSYLKSPHSLVSTAHQDHPSVLCGDPKTFRNVAMTLHGQDLPGKYSRQAFQATMREFNLSRLNLIFLVKMLVNDAVLYERPLVSLYLFISWMHCCYMDTVRLVPAFFVGYLIFNLFDNYERYNLSEANHLGYAPPTLQELLYSLFFTPESGHVKPVLVAKKVVKKSFATKRKLFEKGSSGNLSESTEGEDQDIEPLDHREFPFSERLEYPRFRVEDAIVPSKNGGFSARSVASDGHLYGRLSIYVGDVQKSFDRSGDDDDESVMSDAEDLDMSESEDLHGDGDNDFMESDDEEEEDEGLNESVIMPNTGASRRIPLGPPQNADVKPVKNVPPQVILARAENTLHKLTGSLSMDKIYHSTLALGSRGTSGSRTPVQEQPSQPPPTKGQRRKRVPLDDFDRRLGLRARHPNPVTAITSSFLGPLMRIFRVLVVATRIVFNIGIWKDPFLSFWVLFFLVALMFILIIFPWRPFMFLLGLACFGPQNILVRQRMIRQGTEQEKEKEGNQKEDAVNADAVKDPLGENSEHSGATANSTTAEEHPPENPAQKGALGPRRRLQNKIARIKERRRMKKLELAESEPLQVMCRPAFCASRTQKSSKTPLEPREVLVPYTRFRKERFYDWPPDPTVSRATPVILEDCAFIIEEVSIPAPSGETISPPELRRRHSLDI